MLHPVGTRSYAPLLVVASRLTDPSFRFPTTGVVAGGRLWLVNGQLDKQRDPPPVLPFTVVGVPVP